MAGTNPNGANQHRADPRQELFLSYYFNPKSDTFSNATQSGLKAGYSQEYSENITTENPAWFSEALGDQKRLQKAEKVLEEMLDLDVTQTKITEDGEITFRDPALVKIKQDTGKFVAERMGKHKYSARVETTGPGGEPLIPTDESRNKANDAIASFLGGRSSGSSVTAP